MQFVFGEVFLWWEVRWEGLPVAGPDFVAVHVQVLGQFPGCGHQHWTTAILYPVTIGTENESRASMRQQLCNKTEDNTDNSA